MARKLPIKRTTQSSNSVRATGRRTLKERRRRNRIIVVLVSFVLLIAGGFTLGQFSTSPAISISHVDVRGAALVPRSALEDMFSREAASAYLGLFSKNNAVLLPRKKIEENIAREYKTIEKVDVSFDSFHRAVLSVTERKPAFLVCDPPNTSTCLYADKTGYIFSEAPAFSGQVFLTWSGFAGSGRVGQPNTASTIGSYIMPEADFVALNIFIEHISKIGLKVVSITRISEHEFELHLAGGGVVIVDRRLGYDQTLKNLESVVTAEQTKTRGTFLNNVERIDVRFAGKAFVKMRGQ